MAARKPHRFRVNSIACLPAAASRIREQSDWLAGAASVR